MYGEIFEDYLLGYDFWGMCDMDMIFGDLSRFITTDILEKHDKIYQLGHLTLYRNNKEVNGRFRLDGYAIGKKLLKLSVTVNYAREE